MTEKKFTCTRGKDIQVCFSGGGFYIGVFDETDGPWCRISGYYKTPEEASTALYSGNYERYCSENNWCNGGCGCQVEQKG